MITEGIIEKNFDWIIKCSLRSRLNRLSLTEKRELLEDKLNSREKKDYDMLTELYDEFKNIVDTADGGRKKMAQKRLDMAEERLFEYDKRIFSDYKPAIPQKMGITFPDGSNMLDYYEDMFEGEHLVLEQDQLRSQRNINITDKEVGDINQYINDGYLYINGSMYNARWWNNLNDSEKGEWREKMPSIKQGIDNAIEKSDGLTQNTILYYGGRWDISLEPGQHFNFKGYTSFSYRENVARTFMMGKNERTDPDKWLVVAYSPENLKGLAIEDNRFKSVPNEHEYLTARGQGGTVWDYDEDEHIVYVYLDK